LEPTASQLPEPILVLQHEAAVRVKCPTRVGHSGEERTNHEVAAPPVRDRYTVISHTLNNQQHKLKMVFCQIVVDLRWTHVPFMLLTRAKSLLAISFSRQIFVRTLLALLQILQSPNEEYNGCLKHSCHDYSDR